MRDNGTKKSNRNDPLPDKHVFNGQAANVGERSLPDTKAREVVSISVDVQAATVDGVRANGDLTLKGGARRNTDGTPFHLSGHIAVLALSGSQVDMVHLSFVEQHDVVEEIRFVLLGKIDHFKNGFALLVLIWKKRNKQSNENEYKLKGQRDEGEGREREKKEHDLTIGEMANHEVLAPLIPCVDTRLPFSGGNTVLGNLGRDVRDAGNGNGGNS